MDSILLPVDFILLPMSFTLFPVDSSLLSIDSTSCKLSQQPVSQHLSCLCLFMGQCHPSPSTQKPSPSEAYVSWDFPSCGRIVGHILELQRGWQFETPLCSAKSGLLSSYDGHLRNLN